MKANYEAFKKKPSIGGAQQLIQQFGAQQLPLAWRVYHTLLKAGITPNTEIITLLAKASREAHQPRKAVPFLWEELMRHSLPITAECFNALAHACKHAGDHFTAEHMLALAKERSRQLLTNSTTIPHLCAAFRAGNRLDKALELLQLSEQIDPTPSQPLYSIIFAICKDTNNLQKGRQLHKRLVSQHSDLQLITVSSLIAMYSSCGRLNEAISLFESHMDKYSTERGFWTAMLTAYRDRGQTDKVFELFDNMIAKGVIPDNILLTVLLSACNTAPMEAKNKERVKQLYHIIKEHNVQINKYTASTLITSYSKTGNLSDAEAVFEAFIKHNRKAVSVFTAMINGYALNGQGTKALQLFNDMVREGAQPEEVTMTAVLNAFAKAGLVDEALSLFHSMNEKYGIAPSPQHTSCMVVALVDSARYDELVQFLSQRQQHEINSNVLYYPLAKCSQIQVIDKLYSITQQHHIQLDCVITTALITAYARHGQLDKAQAVFNRHKDTHNEVAVWNAMISGCGFNGQGAKAIETFHNMIREGVKPNANTMVSVLNACAKACLVDETLSLFHSMKEKYGIVPDARHVSCAVVALVDAERYEEVLQLIPQLSDVDHAINYVFAKCNDIEVIDKVYSLAQNRHLDFKSVIALVDRFSKHGQLDKAHEVFTRHKDTHNEVGVWNAMINGYTLNGQEARAMETFLNMIQEGVKPNAITMIVVLKTLAKEGLADAALSFFHSMEKEYGITPDQRHRAYVKGALLNAGRVEEAQQFAATEAN